MECQNERLEFEGPSGFVKYRFLLNEASSLPNVRFAAMHGNSDYFLRAPFRTHILRYARERPGERGGGGIGVATNI